MRLGVRASIRVAERDGVIEYVAFGKDKSAWRLLWDTAPSLAPNDRDSAPLVNASRAHRMKAIEALPALRDALIEEAARQVADIRSATERLRLFLGSIR